MIWNQNYMIYRYNQTNFKQNLKKLTQKMKIS